VTRVVGGLARGRRLATPAGRRTRPTSDRAREGLFDTLQSLLELAGARVLDLYAGSGAVGLEALSRGASHALLVDDDPHAVRTLRANAAALGLEGAQVRAAPVERVLAAAPPVPYDLAFLDPPYAVPVEGMLAALVTYHWLRAGAVCVVERSSRGPGPHWPPGITPVRARRYGEATLWYGLRS
jgi:16S rRNA (guanine966-N2)-methyltransferase